MNEGETICWVNQRSEDVRMLFLADLFPVQEYTIAPGTTIRTVVLEGAEREVEGFTLTCGTAVVDSSSGPKVVCPSAARSLNSDGRRGESPAAYG